MPPKKWNHLSPRRDRPERSRSREPASDSGGGAPGAPAATVASTSGSSITVVTTYGPATSTTTLEGAGEQVTQTVHQNSASEAGFETTTTTTTTTTSNGGTRSTTEMTETRIVCFPDAKGGSSKKS